MVFFCYIFYFRRFIEQTGNIYAETVVISRKINDFLCSFTRPDKDNSFFH